MKTISAPDSRGERTLRGAAGAGLAAVPDQQPAGMAEPAAPMKQ